MQDKTLFDILVKLNKDNKRNKRELRAIKEHLGIKLERKTRAIKINEE